MVADGDHSHSFRDNLIPGIKMSKYSKYFDIGKPSKEKSTCKLCGKIVSYQSRSTSSMKYHVETVHDIKFETSESESKPPEEKKMKTEQASIMDNFVRVKKPTLEELVSREATKGVSFDYIVKSELIQKGIRSYGYNPPKSGNTVRKLVHKSAENHRKIYRDKFQVLLKNKNQRFCTIADEWTCPSKKRKYLNVMLHLKGNYFVTFTIYRTMFSG